MDHFIQACRHILPVPHRKESNLKQCRYGRHSEVPSHGLARKPSGLHCLGSRPWCRLHYFQPHVVKVALHRMYAYVVASDVYRPVNVRHIQAFMPRRCPQTCPRHSWMNKGEARDRIGPTCPLQVLLKSTKPPSRSLQEKPLQHFNPKLEDPRNPQLTNTQS